MPRTNIFQRREFTVFEAAVYKPVIYPIPQGRKEMNIGQQFVELEAGGVLLVSHDLQVASKITQASKEYPYRALIFSLDLSILRGLYEQVGEAASQKDHATSLPASKADPAWTEPMVRYLTLMNANMDAQVLGQMISRKSIIAPFYIPSVGCCEIPFRWTAMPVAVPNPYSGKSKNFGNLWRIGASCRNEPNFLSLVLQIHYGHNASSVSKVLKHDFQRAISWSAVSRPYLLLGSRSVMRV